MPTTEVQLADLTAEQAAYIERLVASGAYTTPAEVVQAGLHALRDRESEIETWLTDEVVPVYDAMQADPGRGVTADQVAARLRAQHEAWKNRESNEP